MLEENTIKKLEELVARPESPQFGWCSFEDQRWLTEAVQGLPENALIVEIGTFKGKATAVMALACLETKRRIVTIDPFIEYTHCFGKTVTQALGLHQSWEEIYQDFLHLFKGVPFVSHIRKSSHQAAKGWNEGEIDMIWIDGDHFEEMVLLDLNLWCPLVKKGGIISGHDWRWESVRKGIARYTEDKIINVTNKGNCWSFIK